MVNRLRKKYRYTSAEAFRDVSVSVCDVLSGLVTCLLRQIKKSLSVINVLVEGTGENTSSSMERSQKEMFWKMNNKNWVLLHDNAQHVNLTTQEVGYLSRQNETCHNNVTYSST